MAALLKLRNFQFRFIDFLACGAPKSSRNATPKNLSKQAQKIDIYFFVRIFARMHRRFFALTLLTPLALVFAADSPSPTQFKYPPAPSADQVDDYSGAKVADPYRPLEN